MSDMYAIKASTLTALGDAVRGKFGIGTEYVDICFESSTLQDYTFANESSAHSYRYIINATLSNRNSARELLITEKNNNNNGTILFREFVSEGESTITVETKSPVIYLQYSLLTSDTNKLACNITAIPLDENGNEYKYTPLEMAEQINGLMTLPESALIITGNCSHRFAEGGWNWFIENYGDRIKTTNISDCSNMFYSAQSLTEIPFEINLSNSVAQFTSMFTFCYNLKELPLIKGDLKPPTGTYSGNPGMQSLICNMERLRTIPYDYFDNFGGEEFWSAAATYGGNRSSLFSYCYSLRQLPNLSKLLNMEASSYSGLYCSFCNTLSSVDEIINVPVSKATLTSNCFSSSLFYCGRCKEFTFATNEDGTPQTANWKNQIIDLTRFFGYSGSAHQITGYNSGITAAKRVTDDASYQALKNDPDWFTERAEYSRYNHDSAVNTINSLPDTSAYGTNTIKFKGAAGSATDGGAINTLTEEEIAMAAAKGWTVTLV